ncbi:MULTISPECIES: cytochrome b [Rhizobium]|uniref:Cytochrome b n=1 Tax=Rhizobium tropici TaxID=398 RepID=A0A6P1CCX5_RHITR|nr:MULTISPECIES: cytochrome b/b6 domain-containing protein [Rhizobium]AGB75172.1 putative transmembrane cytochrome b562 [Rhizobium tropici CIAT 899]MBB4242880.1 cytochrome b561 [Rhizobium tropici]MBB5594705.1 cytochrome b561 [Rhizobium tropici]MBB6493205.1 cytochrome b561 [Rhizobium tropici]NEV14002.1 cytochrome b [Rhizobium tropici]
MSARSAYSVPQRILHWLMALLIFFNLLFPDGMNAWRRLIRHGQTPTSADIANANIHAYAGIAILLLAIVRLALKFSSEAPSMPDGQPVIVHYIASVTHVLLYALIFAMPLSGMAAYYLGVDTAAFLHGGPIKAVLWTVVVLHIFGALVQHFYFRSDVLRRMTIG